MASNNEGICSALGNAFQGIALTDQFKYRKNSSSDCAGFVFISGLISLAVSIERIKSCSTSGFSLRMVMSPKVAGSCSDTAPRGAQPASASRAQRNNSDTVLINKFLFM